MITKLDRRLETVERILPTLATRVDLERFATKDELREGLAEAKRHTDMRFDDLRDDIGKVAEGVAALSAAVADNQQTLAKVVQRLDVHESLLVNLVKKHGL